MIHKGRDPDWGDSPTFFGDASLQRGLITELKLGSKLTSYELIQLTSELLHIYLDGFMHPENPPNEKMIEHFHDLHSHLASAERLLIIRADNTLCGFACSSLTNTPEGKVYYVHGLIIHSDFQGKGKAVDVLNDELQETDADLVAFHTQSRSVEKLFSKVAILTDEYAIALEDILGGNNLQGLVDTKRYGGKCLYGDTTRFRNEALSGIHFERGDARFFAGRVRK